MALMTRKKLRAVKKGLTKASDARRKSAKPSTLAPVKRGLAKTKRLKTKKPPKK